VQSLKFGQENIDRSKSDKNSWESVKSGDQKTKIEWKERNRYGNFIICLNLNYQFHVIKTASKKIWILLVRYMYLLLYSHTSILWVQKFDLRFHNICAYNEYLLYESKNSHVKRPGLFQDFSFYRSFIERTVWLMMPLKWEAWSFFIEIFPKGPLSEWPIL